MKPATLLTSLLSSSLPLLSLAAPALSNEDPAPKISIMAAHSGEPNVHLFQMQAAGRAFWLGGKPSTYCPDVVDECPAGKETVISGLSSLDTMVPGGQRMYVEPSGALGFTQAHSAQIPPGSAIGGFGYTPGDDHGKYTFNGLGADGFMACPHPEKEYYQVFANMKNATVPSGNVDECLGFVAMAYTYDGPTAAWQYA